MSYVLESKNEFDRLDQQSKLPSYDYTEELAHLDLRPGEELLDAGSGSGIVAHYLATLQPGARILGAELSQERVQRANEKYKDQKNLGFTQADLLHPDLGRKFDKIVCRYVLSHFNSKDVTTILDGFYQHLKPNGILYLVDVDGLFLNLYPQTPFLAKCLHKLGQSEAPNMNFGRTLPFLVHQSGFSTLQWEVLTKTFDHQSAKTENQMITARIQNAHDFFKKTLGSEKAVDRFLAEYTSTLSKPGSSLFYNFFVLKSKKPGLSKLSAVKTN